MNTKSCKAKGRRLQLSVAHKIAKLINLPCEKDGHIQPREMGQAGPDIRMSKLAREIHPFTYECKNQESWRPLAWLDQAKKNCYPGTKSVLVCKKNREPAVIMMYLNDFFEFLEDDVCQTNAKTAKS